MNMIVNKSDLVGYEAVDRTTAKKEALAKLVAAWESKQAKNEQKESSGFALSAPGTGATDGAVLSASVM